jgi:hypothetical protein
MPQHARRRQGTQRVPAPARFRIGFPAYDPSARLGRWSFQSRRQRPVGRAYKQLTSYPMPNKQPSFSERIELLQHAVKCLDEVANLIDAEVERMAAAAKRFSERRSDTKRKASR